MVAGARTWRRANGWTSAFARVAPRPTWQRRFRLEFEKRDFAELGEYLRAPHCLGQFTLVPPVGDCRCRRRVNPGHFRRSKSERLRAV